MATGGLYGSSGTGALIAQPGSESSGLYGNSTSFGGTYFEWFVFQTSETQPATPTGGTWNFTTNANTPPTGWSSAPPSNPLNTVWVSIAIVNSKNTAPLVWSVPGKFAFSSGLPILFGNGAPQPGDGQSDQLYVQLDTTPQTIWAKETGTWTRLTGSTLYADLTSNQTIAGTKTFSSQIQGSISGTASNVTGTVAISNGGTGATTAASARAALGAAELGANADITSMTGVTGGISTPDFVQFDTGITPTVGVGKLQWDPTHGCMQVGLVGGNVNLQIGEETVAYVYNNTGSTITEGQVVRVVGSQGQRLTVALAQADGDPNSATILGMATENIANNSSGFITTQGVVNNLNTNGFADGTLLYLSPTVPGGVTATKPVAPQHLVWIGYVVKGNSGGAGSIYIHTQNGYELDELHNVKITDPVADNSFLVYDATLEVWQNEAPSAARTSLELGSAAVLNAGSANGVATLDAGGTVPLSQIPASIQGGVSYQGTWNATTNTPTLTSSVGTKGYYYVVSVAGSTNLNGITSWNIGDWAIYNGTAWEKIDNTDAVTSVNGYTGTVVLNYADVGAPSITGVNATGTWGINVTGNAATATTAGSATTATTATNVSGGTASVTTLTTSSTVTLNGGTANGVAYLNGSKVLTTGSALTFDGSSLAVTLASTTTPSVRLYYNGSSQYGLHSMNANGDYVVESPALNGVTSGQLYLKGNAAMLFGVGGSEQMRLTSTGLGIGTSSPGTKLDVVGAGTFKVDGSGSTTPLILRNNNTASTQVVKLAFDSNGAIKASINAAVYNNDYMTFNVGSDTERMRLDSSGNLGLGVTPSAWLSAFKAFELSSGSIAAISTNELDIGQNNFYSASLGTWAYKNTSGATQYRQTGSEHRWFTAPSGTAGNAISFTQAMTLDASGNLGVGTTSPSTRLHVAGGSVTEVRVVSSGSLVTGSASLIRFGGSNSATSGYFGYGGSASTIDVWNSLSGAITFGTSNLERARIDSSGNITSTTSEAYLYFTSTYSVGSNTRASIRTVGAGGGSGYGGDLRFSTRAPNNAWNTDAVTIDSSGNLLVGTTSQAAGLGFSASAISGAYGPVFRSTGGTGFEAADFWNITTTGDNVFCYFRTEAGGTVRGSVQYNRAGGLTAYNTTSDYRAKDIIGPVTDSGALIDSVPVYMGKMKGATQERPMFIAHETPAYAHTGEKDAVDADGNPVYQQMDVSALVPVMWAEIQSLRQRLAALESN